MKRVLCFGEALIDFLNTGQQHEGDLSLNAFTQYPGGAPANAAVAVAKLGGDAAFAGQVGDDQFGHFLIDALRLYGERSFSFRRDGTADIVMTREQVGTDWFRDQPVVHFCSNTLTDAHIADVTRYVVAQARQRGSVVSFDVNLRHKLWPADKVDAGVVNELVHAADVVDHGLLHEQ